MSIDWFIQGGPIMYLLLVCSLVSLTITFERILFWYRFRRNRNGALAERVARVVGEGRFEEAARIMSTSEDSIVRVFRFGLTHREESMEAALRMGAGHEIRSMAKYLKIHDTIITLAPLLGILGTVLGIITAFDVIGGSTVEDPIAVTGGIAQALVTTAAGLVVAMFSLIPFNYFTARMDDAISEMESHLTNFEIMFRRGRATDEA